MGIVVIGVAVIRVLFNLHHIFSSPLPSGEIDRCIKKVSEGVETFEDIWQKVNIWSDYESIKFE